jgi:hypothetical protein
MRLRTQVLAVAVMGAVVAVSSALARSDNPSNFTVTSSLDGKTVLPLRSHWIAYPQIDPSQGQVTEVDYMIDGYHAWTARDAPWYYGDTGNWLVTSPLKPGEHTFVVRALTADNQVAVDKFQARVITPPKPPTRLAGQWTRAGTTLLIDKHGWSIGPNQVVDVQYLRNGNVVIGALIINRPEQQPACGPNPRQPYKVTLPAGGKRMRLAPIGSDTCSIRAATFTGTWKRAH